MEFPGSPRNFVAHPGISWLPMNLTVEFFWLTQEFRGSARIFLAHRGIS